MSKQESGPDLKEKLKSWFKLGKGGSTPLTTHKTQTRDIVLTPDVLREICPESPANNRIRTIRELSETVKKKRLEENATETLWRHIRDLIQPEVNSENRQVALHFLKCLLEGQLQYLGILRGHFFSVTEKLSSPEDLQHRLDLFKILSENGKSLHDFEDETGPFLLKWMPEVISAGYISDFLSLLINVIKYNAAYLYEDEVAGLVQQTCMIPNSTRLDEEHNLKLCLSVLDSVVSYSYLPTSALYHFVAALCHLVNKPKFCDDSWELMRKLLGTHLGHSAIYTMCCMLQDSKHLADCLLLRGAVFFIGMALWGAHRVTSLRNTYTSVLPSFRQVLSTFNWLVTYEVTKSIQRLVRKYGKDLQHITWDILLDIIEIILKQLHAAESGMSVDSVSQCGLEIHDVLTAVEDLHRHGHFLGSPQRFFAITELCSSKRPESSVEMLMEYHAQTIHPGKENWMQYLSHLMDKYFRQETRTGIRKKALDILSLVLSINKHVYESDLVERVVLPQLVHIEADTDPEVRKVSVEMLLVLTQDCKTTEFLDIMAVIEKVIHKPLRTISPPSGDHDGNLHTDEGCVVDVKTAVLKLCEVFKHRLYVTPSAYCVKIYDLLILHINTHYIHYYMGSSACCIRQAVLELFLQLRSDSFHRIGLADTVQDGPCPFSPYITCNQRDESEETAPSSPVAATGTSPSPWYQPPATIHYTDAFKLYITCLQHELDWQVLRCVLEHLPLVLQNKTLILTTTDHMVATLCQRLCAMVNDRSLGFPEKLQRLPTKFTRSDFHSYVFPVLATMVTYHDYLDRNGQKELLKCLEFGLVSKCAKTCVSSLRISALEMQEVMMRLLPSVLLSLSKISATMSMAIPVLAFLSSIVRLSNLYANFVEDQYMSVFAIALPYTNPFKFSHYTVSLAHHVIAVWFIRCRLPFRKGFVKFIHKGLKANVLQQFEENSMNNLQNQDSRQQDSSNRIRSGSYSEGGHVRRRMMSGSAVTKRDPPPVDEKMTLFHRELTETCTDMMARYAFGNFAAVPHRSQLVQFLLAGTQSQTWLLGNKIISITTSGSGLKASNSGVCEKCTALYQEGKASRQPSAQSRRERRRHKSAACLSRSQSQVESLPSPGVEDSSVQLKWSQDDLSVPRTGDEVGVQTSSSLLGDSLDSFLGLKTEVAEKQSVRSLPACTCWCSGWAEVNIRGPSGNISWVMRIENEMSSSQEVSLQDITMLFKPLGDYVTEQGRKIDSESLGEEEYESLYSKHFSDNLDDTSIYQPVLSPDTSTEQFDCLQEEPRPSPPDSDSATITSIEPPVSGSVTNTDIALHSPCLIRKTNSSPSLLGSYHEEFSFSPDREMIVHAKCQTCDISEEPAQLISQSLEQTTPSQDTTTETVSRPAATPSTLVDSGSTKKQTLGDMVVEWANLSDYGKPQHKNNGGDVTPHTDSHAKQISQTESVQQMTSSSQDSSVQEDPSDLPAVKKRGHTISVMSPAQDIRQATDDKAGRGKEFKGGVSPSFVFLQLFHNQTLLSASETPVLLPQSEAISRALRMLDHIHPYETHKIAVIYVGPGQATDEKGILCNLYGSPRYAHFVQGLGDLLHLKEIDPDRVHVGGLSLTGTDGEFAYSWQDESMQVIFHIATLMPNRESDPNCNAKKLHIGNDFVTIVYNDSGEDYKMGTIKGQFNYVNIVIRPLDYESNAVTLQTKEASFEFKGRISTDIADSLGHRDTKIISDGNLAVLVRQIAMHCNLASMVLQRQQSQPQDPFASNWLERLRQIKRIRQKARQEEIGQHEMKSFEEMEQQPFKGRSSAEDFTDYV